MVTINEANVAKKLKEAKNEVTVTGVLDEKLVEVKEYTDKNDGSKYNGVQAVFSIRTGENEVHQLRYFSKELTKAGAENKIFKAMLTAGKEFVSVADAAAAKDRGEDLEPSKVTARGGLGMNEFYAETGELRQYAQINGRFINRVKDNELYEPGATFETQAIVSKVLPIYENDEETNRLKIETYIPLYNSVIPFNFTMSEAGKTYAEDNFAKGSSVHIYGDIINIQKEVKKEIEMGFGSNRIETTYEYNVAHLIQSGSVIDPDSKDYFDITLLPEALAQREKKLEVSKTNNAQQQSKPATGQFGNQTIASKGLTEEEIVALDVANLLF